MVVSVECCKSGACIGRCPGVIESILAAVTVKLAIVNPPGNIVHHLVSIAGIQECAESEIFVTEINIQTAGELGMRTANVSTVSIINFLVTVYITEFIMTC